MTINNIKLLNFLYLTKKEQFMVLKWRNRTTIRKWMYTSEIISQENHFNFLKILKNDQNKKYFLLQQDNSYIGVIYFTNIDFEEKNAEFGLYSNPELYGLGHILQEVICIYAFNYLKINTLIAKVLKNNYSAIKLYQKFKFIKLNNTDTKEYLTFYLRNHL